MARFRYFADTAQEPIELKNLHGLTNAEFAARFPGVKGRRQDSFSMWVGFPVSGAPTLLPVSRIIEFKQFPSRHECDDRCLHATGRVMRCECKCGGKNHGRGSVSPVLRAVELVEAR